MRCMLEIAALYFLLLSIASTYVVSVAGYKVSISVKPLRVVSFNIIIVCPRHETIYHESERTKKKERGGGETVPFHATSMPYPNPNTPIPSRKRTIFP